MAIRELDDHRGVLVLVASETAAILSYGIAAQKARSQGIIVKVINLFTVQGRRGSFSGPILSQIIIQLLYQVVKIINNFCDVIMTIQF